MEENVSVENAEGLQPSVNASYHLIFLHGNYNLTHYIFYFIDCISVQVQLFIKQALLATVTKNVRGLQLLWENFKEG